jgi:CPA2 family monovalent cation:H+ antiporter-2
MAQIGEFSFVIATLGLSLHVISDFIYPIAVAVSVACMAASPYLTRSADNLANGLRAVTPRPVRLLATSYSGWLENLKPVNENAAIAAIFRRLLWHIAINVLLVVALFIIGAYINAHNWDWFTLFGIGRDLRHTVDLGVCVIPFVADADCGLPQGRGAGHGAGRTGHTRAVCRFLHAGNPKRAGARYSVGNPVCAGVAGCVLRFDDPAAARCSALLILVGLVLAIVLWRGMVKMHARLQAALKETLDKARTTEVNGLIGPSG